MHESSIPATHPYLERVEIPHALMTGYYGAMLAIWHLRQPMQQRFPLHKGQARDYARWLAWCAGEGRREYAILRSIPAWDEELSRPIALPPLKGDEWRDGFSVVMFLYGIVHGHYTFRAILERASVRNGVATAFWRGERHVRFAPSPAPWQREFLVRKFGSIHGLIDEIRGGAHDVGKTNVDLLRKFHLTDLAAEDGDKFTMPPIAYQRDKPAVPSVNLPSGLKRSPVRVPAPLLQAASVVEWINRKPSDEQVAAVTRLVHTSRQRLPAVTQPFGVNLFGYARGELGIGEDVRRVASALRAEDIPFCIVNVQPGAEVSQKDRSVDHWIIDKPHYGINLFCVTGVEHARLVCEHGLDAVRERYNIGLWPWELPDWPESCQYTFGVADELWGISEFTAHAYRQAPYRVLPMSLPVEIGPVSSLGRTEFHLPESAYLFLFAFDVNSTVARKNPEAVIRAFQKAFPRESADAVGLVLKINSPSRRMGQLPWRDRLDQYWNRQRAWHAVRAIAEKDPRIHIIDDSIRRPDLLALYRACDCFVSLHRAEGFGRCIAEALLLDLQVIATDYSGNRDFCHEPRVALVRSKLRALRPDEYFWSQGQSWAEPDIDHAAELMRDVRERPRDIKAGRVDFSPEEMGRRYAKRLREIGKDLGLRSETSPRRA